MEERLITLEAQLRSTQAELTDFKSEARHSLDELSDDVKTVKAGVQRLEIALAKMTPCAAPSSCLTLRDDMRRTDARLLEVERANERINGGFKVAVLGGSAIGALVGWVVSIFIHKP